MQYDIYISYNDTMEFPENDDKNLLASDIQPRMWTKADKGRKEIGLSSTVDLNSDVNFV